MSYVVKQWLLEPWLSNMQDKSNFLYTMKQSALLYYSALYTSEQSNFLYTMKQSTLLYYSV
jgi:hypothetical protein